MKLCALEFGDSVLPPALGAADEGGEHQLEDGVFTGNALSRSQPAALLEEETLEGVGRANKAAMVHGASQMRDASLEVVFKTGHRRRMLLREAPYDGIAQDASVFRGWSLVRSLGSFLEVGTDLFGKLLHEVAHPVRQATLTQRRPTSSSVITRPASRSASPSC